MAEALLLRVWGRHSIGYCQESSSENYRRRHFHVRRLPAHPRCPGTKKAQGVKLGGLNAKGIVNREEALERAEQPRPVFAELAGMSHRKMAAELNAQNPNAPRAANGMP